MVTIQMDQDQLYNAANIVVFGCGGGGSNAVQNMIASGVQGVRFVVANTDIQALELTQVDSRIPIGKRLTNGLGAGGCPEVGRDSALEDQNRIAEILAGANMVFVTAGMGGGTGTGSAPVVAKIARDLGALTVGVVTRPFRFEGTPRQKNADLGIRELAKCVDSLIVIPNDRLLEMSGEKLTFKKGLKMADQVLLDAVRAISDIIVVPGLINVDFADAKRIMQGKGKAIIGMGEASGEDRALQAAERAMTSRLLEEAGIQGATALLVNIAGGEDLDLMEVSQAMDSIQAAADPTAEIIFGCAVDPTMGDRVKVTLIATGFDTNREAEKPGQMSAGTTVPMQQNAGNSMLGGTRPTNMLGGGMQTTQATQTNRNIPVLKAPVADSRPVNNGNPYQAYVVDTNRSARNDARRVTPMADLDRNLPDNWF